MRSIIEKKNITLELKATLPHSEDVENYRAVGAWGCGNCGKQFIVPNDDRVQPRYCPFCGDHDLLRHDKA